ncbi:unnamed protein product [Thelazia callipaeda]|uniref:SERPIN domain-containing protein n=1 Tax=Thelazia callipaeda TaxID=103827 RepID=A0A0N5CTT8_THECL|nr:unnamed protein product [Thelazia callipaeda]
MDVAQADFALNLLKVTAELGKSSILSPLSISTALFMLYAATSGRTRQELNEEIEAYIEKLLTDVASQSGKNYTLSIASRIYVRPTLSVKRSYYRFMTEFYNERVYSIDYNKISQVIQVGF